MSTDHPRVLHVGFQPIGAPTNSGLTLGTMFGGWPREALLQLCLRDHPAVDRPHGVLIAPGSVAPVDGAVRALLGRHTPVGATDGLNNSIRRSSTAPSLSTRARVVLTTANDIGPVRLPRSVMAAVEAFQPQVVHSLLGGVRAMRLPRMIAERLGVPLVPHFMDDWIEHLFDDGQLYGHARRAAQRELERTLVLAPLGLVIGEDMKREYQQRLSLPCVVVGNSVDVDAYRRSPGSAPAHDEAAGTTATLVYVGGLHLGRDTVLRQVAQVLSAGPVGELPWELVLHVPPADQPLAETLAGELPGVVRAAGSVDAAHVPQTLAAASALVFIESSEPHISAFTRLSVSTKVPQYLASNKPVLVVGPQEQSSVRALRSVGRAVYAGPQARGEEVNTAVHGIRELVEQDVHGVVPDLDPAVVELFGTETTRLRLQTALRRAIDGVGPGRPR